MTTDNRKETKICQHVGEEKNNTRNPQIICSSTGSVWRFHLVIISSTIIPVWSKETAIYCWNWSPSILKTLLRNMKINKPSWFVHFTKHDVRGHRGRVTLWHALPWWKDSCRTNFGSHCSISDSTCGVFQVLSVRKNEWLQWCCSLWRVMSKDKLYEKLKKRYKKSINQVWLSNNNEGCLVSRLWHK